MHQILLSSMDFSLLFAWNLEPGTWNLELGSWNRYPMVYLHATRELHTLIALKQPSSRLVIGGGLGVAFNIHRRIGVRGIQRYCVRRGQGRDAIRDLDFRLLCMVSTGYCRCEGVETLHTPVGLCCLYMGLGSLLFFPLQKVSWDAVCRCSLFCCIITIV